MEQREKAALTNSASFRGRVLSVFFSLLKMLSLKDVFNNLPVWAAALPAGTPHSQLRGGTQPAPDMDFLGYMHTDTDAPERASAFKGKLLETLFVPHAAVELAA